MAKLVIDVDTLGTPVDGDTIVFKDKKWQLATHGDCFANENKKINDVLKDNQDMRNELLKMKNDLKTMAIAIKGARK